jgi:hypothetical protein
MESIPSGNAAQAETKPGITLTLPALPFCLSVPIVPIVSEFAEFCDFGDLKRRERRGRRGGIVAGSVSQRSPRSLRFFCNFPRPLSLPANFLHAGKVCDFFRR